MVLFNSTTIVYFLEIFYIDYNFCNIIKSHNRSYNGSNLIGTISYFPKIDLSLVIYHLTYLTFLVKFLNQFFESIYVIDLLNQFIIKLVALLACSTLFFDTYVCRRVYSYLLSYVQFKWLIFL